MRADDLTQLRRERKHHMEVRDREQLRFSRGTPRRRRNGVALRTAPIAARVIGEVLVATGIAPTHVAAERGRAARRQIVQRAPVTWQDRGAMAREIRLAVAGRDRPEGQHSPRVTTRPSGC